MKRIAFAFLVLFAAGGLVYSATSAGRPSFACQMSANGVVFFRGNVLDMHLQPSPNHPGELEIVFHSDTSTNVVEATQLITFQAMEN